MQVIGLAPIVVLVLLVPKEEREAVSSSFRENDVSPLMVESENEGEEKPTLN
jgi:hypothetical protein